MKTITATLAAITLTGALTAACGGKSTELDAATPSPTMPAESTTPTSIPSATAISPTTAASTPTDEPRTYFKKGTLEYRSAMNFAAWLSKTYEVDTLPQDRQDEIDTIIERDIYCVYRQMDLTDPQLRWWQQHQYWDSVPDWAIEKLSTKPVDRCLREFYALTES